MFRRRRVAALAVAALVLGVVLGFIFGFVTHKSRGFPYPLVYRGLLTWRAAVAAISRQPPGPRGSWKPARREGSVDGSAGGEANLRSLPYLSGYEPAPASSSVTVHRRDLAFEGLNLVVSGHAPGAILMDMEGRPLHEWRLDFHEVWPDRTPVVYFWRRAHLFPNGDALGIFDGAGIVKVDKDSKLLWAYPGGSHHDLFVAEDGRIYVLNRKTHVVPRLNPLQPVEEDFIAILDPQGKELRSVSVLEAFERSSYAPILHRLKPWGDIFHTNTIEVLDGRFAGRHPAFAKGRVLISIREIDTIAIVDLESASVVWALTGQWKRQHQPTLLADGNLLLFDNQGEAGHSKVIELDPLTQGIVWQYSGKPGLPLDSPHLGSCQRLPNGNTLITESRYGRALEVTRDLRIAWEYMNPHRAREHDELIATLLEVVRLPSDFTKTPFWKSPAADPPGAQPPVQARGDDLRQVDRPAADEVPVRRAMPPAASTIR
jgi:hypothetical protein